MMDDATTPEAERPRAWPTDSELSAARRVISNVLPPTPLVRAWDWEGPQAVHLKLETTQPTGSFKVRGALVAVDHARSVAGSIVTASAGNHGLGVAWAASRLGVEATVVVPETASPVKIDALRAFPVELVLFGAGYDEAEAHALQLAARGAHYVSAYNDPHVIAGQATVLHEIEQQLEGDFTVVAPVGGGGLIAGTALASSSSPRRIQVVGVESSQSRAVSAAVQAGHVVPVPIGRTIADGLAGNIDPTTVSPEIIRSTGVRLEAVSENSLQAALRLLAARSGIYAEGSAAAGVAALLDGKVGVETPIVIIVTGRNITFGDFAHAVS